MKRFLKYSVIVLLLLCVFLPGHFAHASAYTDCVDKADAGNNFYKDFAACSNLPGAPNLQSGIDQSAGANAPKCGVNPFSGACLAAAGAGIAYLILGAMSWLLWLAGTGLDYVLNYTILQMSTNISGMTGINIVWKVIRDLANIAFIFILLYEAILLIISKSSTEKIKGIVAGIIITALLINFSLFFTKIVIDASNVVTVGFYQSIIGAGQSTTIATGGINGNTATISKGISGAFVNDLHVVEFFTAQDPTKLNTTTGQDNKSLIMIGLGGSVLFLVLAFVFFAVSIMYLMRYIVLVVLLMSAPLGYLGIGLPLLKGTQSSWWSTLLGQCIFAPLWMFCCWAILTLVGSPGFLTLTGGATQTGLSSGGAMSQLFSGNGGAAAPAGIPLLINFALVIGLVIGSLTLAKQYAGQGSGMISSWTGKATAFAGGAIMGGSAAALRQTAGWGGSKVADNKSLQETADKGGFKGALAKTALWTGNKAATGSYDIRRSYAGEKTASALSTDFGKGMPFAPKAGEGGYKAGTADNKKKDEAKLDDIIKRYVDKRNWTGLAEVVKSKSDKDQEYIYKKLSERDRASLDTALADPVITARLRSKLSMDDQIKAYTNHKDWTGLATFLRSKTPSEQDYIYEKLSARDRVALDAALADPVLTTRLRTALSIEEREKTEKTAKETAKEARDKARIDEIHKIATDPVYVATLPLGAIETTVKKLPNSQARKLSPEARKSPLIIPYLSVRQLQDMMTNGDIQSDEITAIRANATGTQTIWMNDPLRVADWTP